MGKNNTFDAQEINNFESKHLDPEEMKMDHSQDLVILLNNWLPGSKGASRWCLYLMIQEELKNTIFQYAGEQLMSWWGMEKPGGYGII